MPPSELSVVVLGGFAVLATGLMLLLDRIGARRNARGSCAKCGQPVSIEGGSRLEGKIYCARCTAKLRTRITIAYLSLAALLAVLPVLGVIGAVSLLIGGDSSWWLMAVVIALLAGCLFLLMRVVLGSMRDRNRFTERVEQARAQAAVLFDGNESGPGA